MKRITEVLLEIANIFKREEAHRLSPQEREEAAFRAHMKHQLVSLKKKGLSIPIMTL